MRAKFMAFFGKVLDLAPDLNDHEVQNFDRNEDVLATRIHGLLYNAVKQEDPRVFISQTSPRCPS